MHDWIHHQPYSKAPARQRVSRPALSLLISLALLVAALGTAQQVGRATTNLPTLSTITSNQVECLAVGYGPDADNPQGVLRLIWSGTVTSAKLVGDEFNVGAQSDIYLNGVPIGQSIIDGGLTNGPYCNPYPGATKEWAIDPSILNQGENHVHIESAARPNGEPDEWGMANVHLVLEGSDLTATEFEDFVFTSSYDGSSQPAVLQVPASYDPRQATPLLIAVHGWGDDRWAALGSFAFAANEAGWLLAAPEMHGERSAFPRPPYDHPLASEPANTISWTRSSTCKSATMSIPPASTWRAYRWAGKSPW